MRAWPVPLSLRSAPPPSEWRSELAERETVTGRVQPPIGRWLLRRGLLPHAGPQVSTATAAMLVLLRRVTSRASGIFDRQSKEGGGEGEGGVDADEWEARNNPMRGFPRGATSESSVRRDSGTGRTLGSA